MSVSRTSSTLKVVFQNFAFSAFARFLEGTFIFWLDLFSSCRTDWKFPILTLRVKWPISCPNIEISDILTRYFASRVFLCVAQPFLAKLEWATYWLTRLTRILHKALKRVCFHKIDILLKIWDFQGFFLNHLIWPRCVKTKYSFKCSFRVPKPSRANRLVIKAANGQVYPLFCQERLKNGNRTGFSISRAAAKKLGTPPIIARFT